MGTNFDPNNNNNSNLLFSNHDKMNVARVRLRPLRFTAIVCEVVEVNVEFEQYMYLRFC